MLRNHSARECARLCRINASTSRTREPHFARFIAECGSRPPGALRYLSLSTSPGVKETPRKTSRLPADLSVVKLSVEGKVVAAILSVIATSLFGSAPWSPFPLTVEVNGRA